MRLEFKDLNKNHYVLSLMVLTSIFFLFDSYSTFSSEWNVAESRKLDLGTNDDELDVHEETFDSGKRSTGLPTNPIELMQMIQQSTSMEDATIPSDAIDDALSVFNAEEE